MSVNYRTTSKFHLYFPIFFFLAYLYFTVFLFEFGPWPWPVKNKLELYAYLNAYHIALFLGYKKGISIYYKKTYFSDYDSYNVLPIVSRFILISSIANILFFFPTLLAKTGALSIDFSSSVGELYNKSQSGRSYVIIEYARMLFGPLLSLAFPLTVFFWNRLPISRKLLGFTAILLTILTFYAMGTNNAIANLLITAPWLIYSAHLAGLVKFWSRSRYLLFVTGTGVVFLFFLFYAQGQSTREGSSSYYGYFPAANISVDYDNFMIRGLSPLYTTGVVGLSAYLSQGYYAMSLALDKPYTPTFGLGNSMFVARNIDAMFDMDVLDSTYPGQITKEDGWDLFKLWTSIYPWLASDFSFAGIIFIMYFIGLLFSFCWQDMISGTNVFSIPAFVHLAILIYYFPANNQCVQSGESLTSFFAIIFLWLHTRNKTFVST